jgi:putative membrane protein
MLEPVQSPGSEPLPLAGPDAFMPRYQKTLLAAAVFLMVLSSFGSPYPEQMALQHIPTVAAFTLLALTARRYPLSNAAFTCLILFLLFHILGARYIYSYVPYDRWSRALFGADLTSTFGFRRNHYDRLVHFSFGLLWVRPVREVCERWFGVPRKFAHYTAFEFVLAFSLLYELFEWGLSMVLAPNDVEAYNGQQGDIWDAHKDMSLAMLGALLGLCGSVVRKR